MYGATLREVFERLRSTHQNASVWKTMLQNAAGAVAATLTWNVVQIFIDIPAFCIGAVYSKVCGVYIFTAANFPRFGFFLQTAPLHCSVDDAFVLLRLCCWGLFKLYMVFGMYALWHEYAKGWTTTDLRWATRHLEDISPVPEDKMRQLAGTPKFAKIDEHVHLL